MKFTTERLTLLNSLSRLVNVTERQQSNPFLSSVLIEVEESSLKLTTTDFMITMTETIHVIPEQEGTIVTNAHILHNVLQKISEGNQIAFHYEQNQTDSDNPILNISSASSQFQLSCMPPDAFPNEKITAESNVSFDIDARTIEHLIHATEFALSKNNDNRPYLQGMYLHPIPDQGVLRAVATNGHLMAIAETAIPPSEQPIPSVIVPAKLIKILLSIVKLTKNEETPLLVQLSERKIHIRADQIDIHSRLIDEQYPNYEQILPKQNNKKLTVTTKLFRESIARVVAVSDESTPTVKLAIEQDKVNISARGQKLNNGKEDIVANYSSEPLTIGFNQPYLNSILEHCPEEQSSIFFKDQKSAILVNAGETTKYVLMPINV